MQLLPLMLPLMLADFFSQSRVRLGPELCCVFYLAISLFQCLSVIVHLRKVLLVGSCLTIRQVHNTDSNATHWAAILNKREDHVSADPCCIRDAFAAHI